MRAIERLDAHLGKSNLTTGKIAQRLNPGGHRAAPADEITWTLTRTQGGTLVRMEQSGFRPEDEANYRGASYGWQRYIAALERVAAGLN